MGKLKETYYCKPCNYITLNRYDYTKHCSRQKHLKNTNHIDYVKTEVVSYSNKDTFDCPSCKRIYKFQSGLSRHKSKCVGYKPPVFNTENNIIDTQQRHITVLHNLIERTIEKQNTTIHQLLEKIDAKAPNTVTNNYNHMTINLFLNQHCKDAMNLSDFISSLNLSIEDLEYTVDNGYAKGITNIFLKRLVDMSPSQRPIHCSDHNRLLFHVKDDNTWEEDNKHNYIDKSIDSITQKQIQMIKDWEMNNPGWNKSESGTECYMTMVRELMGGIDGGEKENKYELIKKDLSLNIDLKSIL